MSSQVFFIPASDREPQKVLAKKVDRIFQYLKLSEKIERSHFVALKIHFGEKGNTGYIKPEWLLQLIKRLKEKTSRVFLTDTNTLYTGNRSNAIDHLLLAAEHGFISSKLGIPLVIADGLIGRNDDEIAINLPQIESAKIASTFLNTHMLICLNHFTGHILTGFGAAIKNLGMGCASRAGKLEQHSDVHPSINPHVCQYCRTCFDYCPANAIVERHEKAHILEEKCIGCGECLVVCVFGAVRINWDNDQSRVQEKMVEYAYSVMRLFKGNIGFLSFLVKMTKDCDCMSKEALPILEDIGILASLDPVAVDKASLDMVIEKAGKDILKEKNSVNWSIQLMHGQKIGLGTTDYKLIKLSSPE